MFYNLAILPYFVAIVVCSFNSCLHSHHFSLSSFVAAVVHAQSTKYLHGTPYIHTHTHYLQQQSRSSFSFVRAFVYFGNFYSKSIALLFQLFSTKRANKYACIKESKTTTTELNISGKLHSYPMDIIMHSTHTQIREAEETNK